MRRYTLRSLFTLGLAFLLLAGVRDVSYLAFPDHAIRFDALHLLGDKIEASYIPSIIKSIQYGQITLSGAASNTAAITSVSTSNAVVGYLGETETIAGTTQATSESRVSLTNATTVTGNSGVHTGTIGFVVWEFRPPWVKSVNQYTCTFAGTTCAQTITSVTAAKSQIVWQGMTDTSGSTALSNTCVRSWWTLTNGTTATGTLDTYNPGGCGSPTAGFAVLEFR